MTHMINIAADEVGYLHVPIEKKSIFDVMMFSIVLYYQLISLLFFFFCNKKICKILY